MIARKAASDLAGVTVAPGLRPPNPVADWRKVENETIEKERGDPQAHLTSSVHTGKHLTAPLIDDNDLPDRNRSRWGDVRAEVNRLQPVQPGGALRLPHTIWAVRIVVKGESHWGGWRAGMVSRYSSICQSRTMIVECLDVGVRESSGPTLEMDWSATLNFHSGRAICRKWIGRSKPYRPSMPKWRLCQ